MTRASETPGMDVPAVQALSDRLEIQDLLSRYARAVDTKDWDLYRTVFTADATIDYTSAGAIAGTVDEIVAFFEEVFATIPWSQHLISNIEVFPVPDAGDGVARAKVRAMFFNPLQLPGMKDQTQCGGYYHHDVVRTPDGWRSERLVEDSVWFVNGPGEAAPGSPTEAGRSRTRRAGGHRGEGSRAPTRTP